MIENAYQQRPQCLGGFWRRALGPRARQYATRQAGIVRENRHPRISVGESRSSSLGQIGGESIARSRVVLRAHIHFPGPGRERRLALECLGEATLNGTPRHLAGQFAVTIRSDVGLVMRSSALVELDSHSEDSGAEPTDGLAIR